jgi:hypothetical protein
LNQSIFQCIRKLRTNKDNSPTSALISLREREHSHNVAGAGFTAGISTYEK